MSDDQDQTLLRGIRNVQSDLHALQEEMATIVNTFALVEKGVENVDGLVTEWKHEASEMRSIVHLLREIRARLRLFEVMTTVNAETTGEMTILRQQLGQLSQATMKMVEKHHRRRLLAESENQRLVDMVWGHRAQVMHVLTTLGGLWKRSVGLEEAFLQRLKTAGRRFAPAAWTEPLMPVETSPSSLNRDVGGLLFGQPLHTSDKEA